MAGEEWLEKNLLVVAGVAVGIAFLQVCLFQECMNYFVLICKIQSVTRFFFCFDFENKVLPDV